MTTSNWRAYLLDNRRPLELGGCKIKPSHSSQNYWNTSLLYLVLLMQVHISHLRRYARCGRAITGELNFDTNLCYECCFSPSASKFCNATRPFSARTIELAVLLLSNEESCLIRAVFRVEPERPENLTIRSDVDCNATKGIEPHPLLGVFTPYGVDFALGSRMLLHIHLRRSSGISPG